MYRPCVAYEQKGDYEQALAELGKALALSDANIEALSSIAHVHAVTGRRGEAIKILNELTAMSARKYVDPYAVAIVHAGLGDRDRAFESLEKARQSRSIMMIWLAIEPRFDSLRSDPRYTALVRRMGLPQSVARGSAPLPTET